MYNGGRIGRHKLNIPEHAAQGDVPADIGRAIPFARLKDDATIEAHGLTHINCVKQILEYGNTISCDGLGDLEKFAWGLPTRSPLRIRLGNLRSGRLTSKRNHQGRRPPQERCPRNSQGFPSARVFACAPIPSRRRTCATQRPTPMRDTPIATLSRGRRAKASTTCRIVDDIDDDAYISFMNDIY